ncbi:termination factor Rho [Paenibacillus glycanilyticus]|uniref:termination factor Rho n=1 Tax=Paenibacillus glycanilyticus TaxID=126569 RepID=UPI00203DDE69|nr:termination factor Rho [Paenibacillus glycanilyticus]MCM3628799.1 termination factor Rho [Paenibacillus glycanilyticus]
MADTYTVIRQFKDTKHDGHLYQVGDTYPVEGHRSNKNRIKQLSTTDNKYKHIYITQYEAGE